MRPRATENDTDRCERFGRGRRTEGADSRVCPARDGVLERTGRPRDR